MWFGAILLYGFGASILGSAGSVYGWALGMSVSILTANVWGVAGGEWNGASFQPKLLMLLSTVLLIASFGVLCLTRLPPMSQ
jgi:putative Ca2+/H+ antiporter (TMEM165/GDT1 family)